MLLQEIVREFDDELMRLASLRAIIVDLAHPRIESLDSEITNVLLHSPIAAEPAGETESETEPGPLKRRYTRRLAGGPVVRRARRRRPIETGAIASTAPAGPVVVSAAALERERRDRQHTAEHPAAQALLVAAPSPQPLSAEGSNDLARVLAQRWLSGEGAPL